MLEASLTVSEELPDGASGLWALVHCAQWVALGELEWIPISVLRKSIDVNLLGTLCRHKAFKRTFLYQLLFHFFFLLFFLKELHA